MGIEPNVFVRTANFGICKILNIKNAEIVLTPEIRQRQTNGNVTNAPTESFFLPMKIIQSGGVELVRVCIIR